MPIRGPSGASSINPGILNLIVFSRKRIYRLAQICDFLVTYLRPYLEAE